MSRAPSLSDRIHEIKYDGYRLRVERNGKTVRLITRNGHDWTKRFPWIVEAALKNREQRFVIDGEAVVLGVDGVSDFNALHSRRHDNEVQLYAFDVLALGGEDLRQLPLSLRKTNLARLLRGRPDGMFVAPFEPGEIGTELFGAACRLASRAWCPSAAIGAMSRGARRSGSRSRTGHTLQWRGNSSQDIAARGSVRSFVAKSSPRRTRFFYGTTPGISGLEPDATGSPGAPLKAARLVLYRLPRNSVAITNDKILD